MPVCEVWKALGLRIIGWECGTESSAIVREIPKLKQFVGTADTIPGLTHITLAGAVQDGMKEVKELQFF